MFRGYNKLAVESGFEGIMIKDVDALYECKRSHFMLKAKPFIEVSLTVKATEEGTGRNVGKLGALIVEGEDDSKFIKTNVGSGLTDNNREEWPSNCSFFIHLVFLLKCQHLLVSKGLIPSSRASIVLQ